VRHAAALDKLEPEPPIKGALIMHSKKAIAPVTRKLCLTFAAATLLTTSVAGMAQAQYLAYPQPQYYPDYYGYSFGGYTRYNTPAELHQWYDRGNTDFNS
jgi:hypothetical protein